MNKMTWAKFHPKKTLMRDSIPPPGTDRWTIFMIPIRKLVMQYFCRSKKERGIPVLGDPGVKVGFHWPLFILSLTIGISCSTLFREDPAFKKMVSLCRDSTYTEFFWFPNRGTDEGYWENCWIDDGNEEDAVDINEAVADEYQVVESIHTHV